MRWPGKGAAAHMAAAERRRGKWRGLEGEARQDPPRQKIDRVGPKWCPFLGRRKTTGEGPRSRPGGPTEGLPRTEKDPSRSLARGSRRRGEVRGEPEEPRRPGRSRPACGEWRPAAGEGGREGGGGGGGKSSIRRAGPLGPRPGPASSQSARASPGESVREGPTSPGPAAPPTGPAAARPARRPTSRPPPPPARCSLGSIPRGGPPGSAPPPPGMPPPACAPVSCRLDSPRPGWPFKHHTQLAFASNSGGGLRRVFLCMRQARPVVNTAARGIRFTSALHRAHASRRKSRSVRGTGASGGRNPEVWEGRERAENILSWAATGTKARPRAGGRAPPHTLTLLCKRTRHDGNVLKRQRAFPHLLEQTRDGDAGDAAGQVVQVEQQLTAISSARPKGTVGT
jgi:hypothetical protein